MAWEKVKIELPFRFL